MQHLYNITTLVVHPIAVDWLNWMKAKHIPEIMKSGCFLEYRFLRLQDQVETEGLTFSLQLLTANREDYERYLREFAPCLREDARQLWGENALSFRTLMQVVN
ncbi:MAG: DUF4286 family protein [Sediminibacterium sp.]